MPPRTRRRPAGGRPDHHLQPDVRLPVPAGPEGPRHRHGGRPADRLPRCRQQASWWSLSCCSRWRCRWSYAVGTSLVVITLTSAVALAVRAGVGHRAPTGGWSPVLGVPPSRPRRPARRPGWRPASRPRRLLQHSPRWCSPSRSARPRRRCPPCSDHPARPRGSWHRLHDPLAPLLSPPPRRSTTMLSSRHLRDLPEDDLGRLRPARRPGQGRRAGLKLVHGTPRPRRRPPLHRGLPVPAVGALSGRPVDGVVNGR